MAGERLRELSDADIEQVLARTTGPVLVTFFATWCGACRRLAPVLDAVAGEFAGRVEVMQLNVDENPVAVRRYGVSSTPTLVLFESGQPRARLVGAQDAERLREWLTAGSARSWAPVEACTLPTSAQPLRVAEFGDLFARSLRSVVRESPTRLRLELDAAAEDTARELTARESECCAFFSFTFGTAEPDTVWLEVRVPAVRIEVLDGLAAQAQSARAA